MRLGGWDVRPTKCHRVWSRPGWTPWVKPDLKERPANRIHGSRDYCEFSITRTRYTELVGAVRALGIRQPLSTEGHCVGPRKIAYCGASTERKFNPNLLTLGNSKSCPTCMPKRTVFIAPRRNRCTLVRHAYSYSCKYLWSPCAKFIFGC